MFSLFDCSVNISSCKKVTLEYSQLIDTGQEQILAQKMTVSRTSERCALLKTGKDGHHIANVPEDMVLANNPEDYGEEVFPANAVLPQELRYTVPWNVRAGQRLSIEGPFGPMPVEVPIGKRAGDEVTFRFGPPAALSFTVTIPEGAKTGEIFGFETPDGVMTAWVPDGKQAGDTVEIIPRAMMIEVPDAAVPGDRVVFSGPQGERLTAVVPEACRYFACGF